MMGGRREIYFGRTKEKVCWRTVGWRVKRREKHGATRAPMESGGLWEAIVPESWLGGHYGTTTWPPGPPGRRATPAHSDLGDWRLGPPKKGSQCGEGLRLHSGTHCWGSSGPSGDPVFCHPWVPWSFG